MRENTCASKNTPQGQADQAAYALQDCGVASRREFARAESWRFVVSDRAVRA